MTGRVDRPPGCGDKRRTWEPPEGYVWFPKQSIDDLYYVPSPLYRLTPWAAPTPWAAGTWTSWCRGRDSYAKFFLGAVFHNRRRKDGNHRDYYVHARVVLATGITRVLEADKYRHTYSGELTRRAAERAARFDGALFVDALMGLLACLDSDAILKDGVTNRAEAVRAFVLGRAPAEVAPAP